MTSVRIVQECGAADRGLRSFEFLGSEETWTQIWTDRVRPCVSVRAYPKNYRGMAALAFDGIRLVWERLGLQLIL